MENKAYEILRQIEKPTLAAPQISLLFSFPSSRLLFSTYFDISLLTIPLFCLIIIST